MSIDNTDTAFDVVVNEQGQYSIWPTYRAMPAGWKATGVKGDRQICLDHISEVWTDLRPRRLREAMGD